LSIRRGTGENLTTPADNFPVDPSEWVDRYGDYLFRYAMLRVRDRSSAEDLVQETFLAALKRIQGQEESEGRQD